MKMEKCHKQGAFLYLKIDVYMKVQLGIFFKSWYLTLPPQIQTNSVTNKNNYLIFLYLDDLQRKDTKAELVKYLSFKSSHLT